MIFDSVPDTSNANTRRIGAASHDKSFIQRQSNRRRIVCRAGWVGVTDGKPLKVRTHLHSVCQAQLTHSLKRLWRTGIQMRNRPAERAQIVLLRYLLKNRQNCVGAVIGIGVDLKRYSPFCRKRRDLAKCGFVLR